MRKLTGKARAYPWGSRELIPRLRGEEPADRPVAELWYGAHPAEPSLVDGEGVELDRLIAADPEAALGERVAERFGGRLPFLGKFLAAAEPLSLQAHPTTAQARAGFARENDEGIALDAPNRNYKDDSHKPELIIALTEFRAMVGFRPVDETLELFAAIDCPEAERYVGMLEPGDDADSGLRGLFTTWITIPGSRRRELIDAIVARLEGLRGRGDWIGAVAREVIALQERYPGDVGVLGALLLNHVTLNPGEAAYLEAGQLHAYVSGLGVEVQANSDNVLRGGLTAKYVDVPELVHVLDFRPLAEPRVAATDCGSYPVPAAEFSVRHVDGSAGEARFEIDGPVIAACSAGEVEIATAAGERLSLSAGQAAWLAADEGSATLAGDGEAFWVTC